MKTLDEVITGMTELILSGKTADVKSTVRDALSYLKEYRDKAHRLDIDIAEHHRTFLQLGVEIARYQEAVRNCEEAENKFRKMEDELNNIRREHIEQMKNPDGDHQQLEKARKLLQDFYRNDPLDWKELRQMEGQPVWVELLKGKWKGWDVIGGFYEDDFGVAMVTVRGDDYYKADLGKTWQAYRKERMNE